MRQLFLLFLSVVLLMASAKYSEANPSPGAQQTFPVLNVTDLNGKKMTLPRDFDASYNLCLIAFSRSQQSDVITWINGTKPIIQSAGVSFYEMPTISRLPGFVRDFITAGMRRAIPDDTDRKHTITLFIDKTPFRQSLGLGTEKKIYAILVDRQGNVLWSASGDFTNEDGESLHESLAALNVAPRPV